jgi:regulator of sirC expression with transglutaminase-like and TPR domain
MGDALALFADEVRRPEAQIDLARAALLAAQYRYPGMDPARYLKKLDEFADPLTEAVRDAPDARAAVAAINGQLFERLGFRGNQGDYGDPKNSYLNEVIDRKTGIPITLCILYREVARRVHFPVAPVAFPAHFLVKWLGPGEEIVLDPFNGGREMHARELQALLDGFYGGKLSLTHGMLRPATKVQTLYRMLNNLKTIHVKAEEPEFALAVVERMLALVPDSAIDLRDKGFALHAVGRHGEAAAQLRHYLEAVPGAPDRDQVRGVLDAIENMERLLR